MKVKELIEKLQGCDGELEVHIFRFDAPAGSAHILYPVSVQGVLSPTIVVKS